MRALAGGIPRAFRSHKSAEGWAYGRYARAKVKRLGPLPDDARVWLREAGRLTVALDRLAVEAEDARAVLTNGSGRRAKATARVVLARLERRQARLRGSLEAVEERLDVLAGERPPLDLALAIQAAQAAKGAER